jgi:predicted phosphodiesterase
MLFLTASDVRKALPMDQAIAGKLMADFLLVGHSHSADVSMLDFS